MIGYILAAALYALGCALYFLCVSEVWEYEGGTRKRDYAALLVTSTAWPAVTVFILVARSVRAVRRNA